MLRLDSTLESHLISCGKSLTGGGDDADGAKRNYGRSRMSSVYLKRFLGDKLAQNGNVIRPFIVNDGWKDVGKRGW